VPPATVLVKVAEVVLHKGEIPDMVPAFGKGFTVITLVAKEVPQEVVLV
jgi:hypothetical protein